MFIDIGQRLGVPLEDVPCIGDGLRDLQAAAAAGGRPMLVLNGKGAATLAAGNLLSGTQTIAGCRQRSTPSSRLAEPKSDAPSTESRPCRHCATHSTSCCNW